jgi:hypothetical protein
MTDKRSENPKQSTEQLDTKKEKLCDIIKKHKDGDYVYIPNDDNRCSIRFKIKIIGDDVEMTQIQYYEGGCVSGLCGTTATDDLKPAIYSLKYDYLERNVFLSYDAYDNGVCVYLSAALNHVLGKPY